mgnify:CR=1 FL=1
MSILQTTELKKYYGAKPNITRALDGVTLSIEKGEFVAIVGTSGSGKSTLLNMIGGLDVPTSGQVVVDGKELSKLKDEELTVFRRRKIGFIFQNYNLVPILNVHENIVLPVELDGDTVGQEALHIVHQLRRRIVLVQHAVDACGAGDLSQHLVRAFLHIVLQVAGDVHAGDLVLVPLREGQHFLEGGVGLGGKGGVDIDLVGGGDGVQHLLQCVQVGQRLAAGEHKITPGRDAVHHLDACQYLLQTEAGAVRVFFFVDAEGAVVLAVVGYEHRHGGAAFPRFIGMGHVVDNLTSKCTKTL